MCVNCNVYFVNMSVCLGVNINNVKDIVIFYCNFMSACLLVFMGRPIHVYMPLKCFTSVYVKLYTISFLYSLHLSCESVNIMYSYYWKIFGFVSFAITNSNGNAYYMVLTPLLYMVRYTTYFIY